MYQQWWEQARIDMEGAKKRTAEAETFSDLELELDLNTDLGGEGEWRAASESSGSEWSGAEE